MAKALHVRGIPDELYEALRTAADRDGRSISAETIAILKDALDDRLVAKATIMRNIADRKRRTGTAIDATGLIRDDRDNRSVYLTDEITAALATAAQRERRPQAELIRDALKAYLSSLPQPRLLSLGLGSDKEITAADSEAWLRSRWSQR